MPLQHDQVEMLTVCRSDMSELDDIKIVRIDAAMIEGTRPRKIGLNARRPAHGRQVREPIVRLRTDAGIAGWGWSRAAEDNARELVGRRLSDVFDPATGTGDEYLMFDFPLWDLAGRALGKSVHEMLGDGGDDTAAVYDGSIYIDEIDPETGRDDGAAPVLDAVRMGLAAGHRTFKVKIGRGFQWMEKHAGLRRDVEVIHAVRELIGEEGTLLIDGNDGFTPDEARRLLDETGDCNIYWFEEPFPENERDCLAFKKFIQHRGWQTRIADGEGASEREPEITDIVRAGGIDVVQFDMRGYSLTRWRRYLPVLAETGARAAPHNWGSHLSGLYIAQFGCGVEHFSMGEIDTVTMPVVAAGGYELVDGKMRVPDAPGFGLEVDPSVFAQDIISGSPHAWSVSDA